MRCVRDVTGGAAEARRLLFREEFVKLGGAALRGRYGGGGSARLSLSEKGFDGPGARLLADVMEMTSEVSIPVKYAPFAPEGMGPRMMGAGADGFDGGIRCVPRALYCSDTAGGGAMYGWAVVCGRGCIFIS